MRRRASLILATSLWAVGCGSISQPATWKGPPKNGEVVVRVKGPKGTELWRMDPETRVCKAPCFADVPVERPLEARVRDLPKSPQFEIPKEANGVYVIVEPAPKVLPGLAAVVGTVGGAALLIGGSVALADLTGNDDLEGTAVPGAITAAIGGAVLAAGVVMAVLSGTRVKLREARGTPTVLSW